MIEIIILREVHFMYEEQMIKYMRNMGIQLQNLQALVKNLETAVQNIRVNGNVVSRIEVV